MNSIVSEEKKREEALKYGRVWRIPAYRNACHSLHLWRQKPELFPEFRTMLDIGCGLGLLFGALNSLGYDAWGIDIVDNCLDSRVRQEWGHKFRVGCLWEMQFGIRFDFGVCTDVMEHIPEVMVPSTLERIAATCKEVLFKIAHVPAHPWLGTDEPLHLTVRPVTWWLSSMGTIGGSAREIGSMQRSGFEDSLVRWVLP